jgi:transcriptional regulator with XRE-family HTH domain
MSMENLSALRVERGWSKVEVARSLRLGADVWDKLEQGAIPAESLTGGQAARLAEALTVSADLFLALLKESRPRPPSVCRRFGAIAGPPMQSFATALARSGMNAKDKRYWSSL